MFRLDRTKTTFMIEQDNHQYNIMSFGLKNAGVMYQRIINKAFREGVYELSEVYMDSYYLKIELIARQSDEDFLMMIVQKTHINSFRT